MLPDFSRPKAYAQRTLLRQMKKQVPVLAPLLEGVASFQQHEGQLSTLTRADASTSTIDYRAYEYKFSLTRDEMRSFDIRAIHEKLLMLAKEIGDAQTKRMLEVIRDAAHEVGNVVHAGGDFTQDKFLDVFRRIQMDFDPKTLQVAAGFQWVMHPETAAKVLPKVKEWEKDPAFNARYEQIISAKREEWRDREARRRLVG